MFFKVISFLGISLLFNGGKEKNISQKRQVITEEYTIDFYVADNDEKLKKFKKNSSYTWYKSGKVFTTQGEVGGEVLDGSYSKRYKDNQLAEKGLFKKGLREGEWKTWYVNGKLQTTTKWKKGVRQGKYAAFNELGKLQLRGEYCKNKKNSEWIDFVKKDTIYFKDGVLNEDKIERKKKKAEAVKARKKLKFKERIRLFFDKLFKLDKPKKNTQKKSSKPNKKKVKTKKKSATSKKVKSSQKNK